MDVSLESSPVCSASPADKVPMSPLPSISASLKWTFFGVQKWERAGGTRQLIPEDKPSFVKAWKMSNISVQILCHMGARVWYINRG